MIKNFITKYKKNILQIIGLTIGYLITKSIIFICLLVLTLILIILFPKVYFNVSAFIDIIFGLIGKTIKNILFLTLFIMVIIPISLIQKISQKKEREETSYYIRINKQIKPEGFIKMW